MSNYGVAAIMALMFFASSVPAFGQESSSAQTPVPAPDKVLATLDKSHPRLMLKDAELAALRKQIDVDPLLAKCRDDLLKKADAYCRQPPVAYKLIGPRLLMVSRECLNRVYALGLAWRLTGKDVYADKATENLLAACEFPDWHPAHFLDTAEMAHAVGVGYDWLFSRFDEPTRTKIREGLIRHGLKVGVAAYAKPDWWVKSDFNWNQVCNSGLIIGALAVAESDPEYARTIIPAAAASMPKAMASYEPDGAWGEGPGYWNYATSYTVFGLAALNSALGTDFGLSRTRGLAEAGLFPLLTSGPTGLFFNFADDGQDSRRGCMPCLFWLARRYDLPALAQAERDMIANRPAEPLDLIWYQPRGDKAPPDLPLNKPFRGSVEVAVFRSKWSDTDALFVAAKAGYNQVNHGHLDLGNFVLDALATRWVRDLGSDDYNLPEYWGKDQAAKRWTYYRLGSHSHNVLTIDGQNQNVQAKAKITRFVGENADGCFAIIDLGGAYAPAARSATRGLAVVDNRRALLVQDELDLAKACDVAWGITTDAAIEANGGKATLARDGKKCMVTLLAPADGAFTVEPASQDPPQKENKGISRLMLRLKQQNGPVTIAVLFQPYWPDAKPAAAPKVTPLSQW